jgi:hypothetical protein
MRARSIKIGTEAKKPRRGCEEGRLKRQSAYRSADSWTSSAARKKGSFSQRSNDVAIGGLGETGNLGLARENLCPKREKGGEMGKWRALGSAAAISRRWQPGLAAIIDEKLGERRSIGDFFLNIALFLSKFRSRIRIV